MDFNKAVEEEIEKRREEITHMTQEEVLEELLKDCTHEKIVNHAANIVASQQLPGYLRPDQMRVISHRKRKGVNYDEIYEVIEKKLKEINPDMIVQRNDRVDHVFKYEEFQVSVQLNNLPTMRLDESPYVTPGDNYTTYCTLF